jgi:hypothetical protein
LQQIRAFALELLRLFAGLAQILHVVGAGEGENGVFVGVQQDHRIDQAAAKRAACVFGQIQIVRIVAPVLVLQQVERGMTTASNRAVDLCDVCVGFFARSISQPVRGHQRLDVLGGGQGAGRAREENPPR